MAQKIMVNELEAMFDARQDFYKKAYVACKGDIKVLKSYDTIVAVIKDGQLKVRDKYSQTTTRHIKEFARQNCFAIDKAKDIDKYLDTNDKFYEKYESFFK